MKLGTKISQLAEELAAKYSSEPPIDVERVARGEGLLVFSQELQPDVSGILVRQEDQTFCFINSKDNKRRQRFSLGHELGHFVLGHLKNSKDQVHIDKAHVAIMYRDKNSRTGRMRDEIDANQFAAALLMPTKMVSLALKELGPGPYRDLDITFLAEKFLVSEQAMTLRLGNLRYI